MTYWTFYRNNILVILDQQYSFDLEPCEFWLFSELEAGNKGRHLETKQLCKHGGSRFVMTVKKWTSRVVQEMEGAFRQVHRVSECLIKTRPCK